MTTATLQQVRLTQADVTAAFQKMWDTPSETTEGRQQFIRLYDRWQRIKSEYQEQEEAEMKARVQP
jgi:hypothetical protein